MRFLAATPVLLAAIACGGSTAPGASLYGTWVLESYNNSSLPAVVLQDSVSKLEILGGVLSISASTRTQGYALSLYDRLTIRGVVTVDTTTYAGPYTVSGDAITLSDGPYYPTTVLGDVIVITGKYAAQSGDSVAFAYRFQHQ